MKTGISVRVTDEEKEILRTGAKLSRQSLSRFLTLNGLARTREVMTQVYTLPGSHQYQYSLVIRAIQHGCGTIEDIVQHTALDKHAVQCSLTELEQQGKVYRVAGKKGRITIWHLGEEA